MHSTKQLISKLDQVNVDYYETESAINEDLSIQLVDFDQLCLFIKKHNKDLRRAYIQKLWKEKSVQDPFYSPKHGLYDIRIDTFIEDIWREYKASL